MQTKKISLANIQSKLSRVEMKKIMGGSGGGGGCYLAKTCWNAYRNTYGTCSPYGYSGCLCVASGAGTYSYDCNGYQV